MNFAKFPNGTQIASELPSASSRCTLETDKLISLADLLAAMSNNPPSQLPMLRSTASRITAFIGLSADQVTLDAIYARREGFRPFLEKGPYKENSIRSYVNFLRILLDSATELGWRPLAALTDEWQAVLNRARRLHCIAIAKFLSQTKATPSDIAIDDVEGWLALQVQHGTRYVTAHSKVSRFWRTLVACGHVKNAPITFLKREKYGIPLSQFPSPLCEEVTGMLRWKCADYSPDRPKHAKIREVSAGHLRQTIQGLYGFAINVRKLTGIASLPQLIQKPIISEYVAWCVNERKIQGAPFVCKLAAILAAVSQYPTSKGLDLTWFKPLLNTIPCGSYEDVKSRKARKYIEYSELDRIPAQIHKLRESAAKKGNGSVARVVMEELLIKWFLLLPWRQRNVRECRIDGREPNLFKSKIPPFTYIQKPKWVLQLEAENPNTEFWQFRFSEKETKTDIPVHALIPRQLIALLEEYLLKYRPLLLGNRNCETLFVTEACAPMVAQDVNMIVSDLTLRHGGRRVTPHLIRDIVAFAWLKAHPEDYLTLSKLLWHKNIATTIMYYGSRFNESSGVCAMESWQDEREAKST